MEVPKSISPFKKKKRNCWLLNQILNMNMN